MDSEGDVRFFRALHAVGMRTRQAYTHIGGDSMKSIVRSWAEFEAALYKIEDDLIKLQKKVAAEIQAMRERGVSSDPRNLSEAQNIEADESTA